MDQLYGGGSYCDGENGDSLDNQVRNRSSEYLVKRHFSARGRYFGAATVTLLTYPIVSNGVVQTDFVY